jgi:hypothetical protein
MAVSSDPEASYPQPPKDFFTAVPFAAEGDVDVYLTQRYCGPVFASDVPPATASIMAVTQGPVTNSALHQGHALALPDGRAGRRAVRPAPL